MCCVCFRRLLLKSSGSSCCKSAPAHELALKITANLTEASVSARASATAVLLDKYMLAVDLGPEAKKFPVTTGMHVLRAILGKPQVAL